MKLYFSYEDTNHNVFHAGYQLFKKKGGGESPKCKWLVKFQPYSGLHILPLALAEKGGCGGGLTRTFWPDRGTAALGL